MKFIANKKVFCAGGLALACIAVASGLFAQNIELPDVTTVISGDSIKAGIDALPGFDDVLVLPSDSGKVVPQLPDVDAPASSEVATVGKSSSEKDIFAEGEIGGGYPSIFKGDFSVFRLSGLSPFQISFSYDAAGGFGNHSMNDCFSDRTTNLIVNKKFQKNQFKWGFDASYQALSNGLQNQVKGITNLNQDDYDAKGNFTWEIGNGFSTGLDAGLNFYHRYADVSEGKFPIAAVWIINPAAFVKWEGYGFDISLNGDYTFEDDMENVASDSVTHRGTFGFDAQWANDYVKIFGNVHGLVGNQLNKNQILAPFTVGIDAFFPVYFSNRRFSISSKGGLESNMNRIADLERKYKFTNLVEMPQESSDWFANLEMAVPLKESFTGNLGLEYRHTAFENGYWQPDYESQTGLNAGIFTYSQKNLQQFNSKLSLTYHYKIFSITGGWNAMWMDAPVMSNPYEIFADINFQSEESKWGIDVNGKVSLDSKDKDPVINAEAFVRLTSAVRAVASVNDGIKLFKAEPRTYAGNYITRGGTATFLLKFFF